MTKKIISFSLVILLILFGIFGLFSTTFDMSKAAEISLILVLIAAVLWISEAIPLFATSFVILFLILIWLSPELYNSLKDLPLDNIPALLKGNLSLNNIRGIFISRFFNDIILLFLGGFVLSSAFKKYKLDLSIASFIIKKTGNSRPLLMFGIMFVTAFLSMWMSNTATTAMMIALCLPIINNFDPNDKYRKALLLSIPFSANIGGMGTPIGTPPNAVALGYLRGIGIDIGFGEWMIYAVPTVIILLIFLWFILYKMFPSKSKSMGNLADKEYSGKLGKKGIFVASVSVITALGWLTGTIHKLSAGTIALIPVITMFISGLLDVNDLKGLSWNVLILIGGGFALGKSIELSGLAEWLVNILPQNEGSYIIMIIFGSISVLFASIMSRTATANLMIPIIIQIPFASPLAIIPVVIGATFSASATMPLPVSTPPNAMAFSTGELHIRDMLIPGLIITIIGAVFIFTFSYFWWDLTGLF